MQSFDEILVVCQIVMVIKLAYMTECYIDHHIIAYHVPVYNYPTNNFKVNYGNNAFG